MLLSFNNNKFLKYHNNWKNKKFLKDNNYKKIYQINRIKQKQKNNKLTIICNYVQILLKKQKKYNK